MSLSGTTTARPSSSANPGISVLLLVSSTLFLLVFYYLDRADTIGVFSGARGWTPMTAQGRSTPVHFIGSALLLGVLPVVVGRLATGLSASRLGLGLGNRRLGTMLLLAGAPVAVLAGRIAAGSEAMRAVYPLNPSLTIGEFPVYAALAFLYFAAWECLFRGVLLFGLRAELGDGAANGVQTALSVTAHFGRALTETFAALPAGLVFGWLALRTRSVWYVALLHWLVSMSMELLIIRSAS